MRIQNQTEIDEDILKGMVSIVTKGYTRNIGQIIFKYTRKRKFGGWCRYGLLRGYTPELIIMIGKNVEYPFIMNEWRNKYYPRYDIKDEIELVLAILAHEFAHARFNLRETKNTQVRAEKYAMKVLGYFRTKFWNPDS